MGTDNIFHKRKAKNASELSRKKASRAPYAKVLIVCEGKKTEPNYFNELKDYLALNSANVKVTGDCDSSPISVVEYAIQRYSKESILGDPFEKIFCVFDKDTHSTYPQALEKLQNANPKNTFCAITSVPCFEYWLLLHFGHTTAPFQSSDQKSAADRVIDELRKHIPNYRKGDNSIFCTLIERLSQAKTYAEKALKDAQTNRTDNPSTHVHELVTYLQNIKNSDKNP